jgi:hypothetical protein
MRVRGARGGVFDHEGTSIAAGLPALMVLGVGEAAMY